MATYLKRAVPTGGAGPAAAVTPPDPWPFVALTVAAPIVVAVIGWALLRAVSIENSTGYAVSYTDVRTAITQVLDKDLTEDRINGLLLAALPDPTPGSDDLAKERKTEREAQLKPAAARISGERSKLADDLTTIALKSHPAGDPSVASAARNEERRKAMATVIAMRLTDDGMKQAAQTWVSDALDAHAKTAIAGAIGKPPDSEAAVAAEVARSISFPAIRAAARAAVAPAYNPFDTRSGEAAWTSDVSARLAWAVVALVFALTFLLVVATSAAQMRLIDRSQGDVFLGVTVVAAVAAGLASLVGFYPADLTPLHDALHQYARLLHVAIPVWANLFNILRGVGVVLLIAGAVATFWVEVTGAEALDEQLRGFKTLFNTGTIFLMAGTFEMYAEFRWPTVFAADETTRTALQGAAAAFAATVGAAFSAVTLAAYFATTAVLRRQARAHMSDKEVAAAFEASGFSDLASNQALRFAQALLPLLPGVLTVLAT